MKKTAKVLLVSVAILLILNGLLNIVDNGRVLAYDITSLLSGVGLILVSFWLSKKI